MSSRFVMPFANVGDGITPADGAKLQFYASGTSTPKDTYSDEDLTTANANPVIADADGVFGDIWMNDGDRYKVVLYDKNDVQQWESDPVIGGLLNGGAGLIYDTVADMKLASPLAGVFARTLGYYAIGDGGQGEYLIAATAAVDGYGDHSLANGNIALLQTVDWVINVRQYGANGDGTTDDTDYFDAAIDAANALSTIGSGAGTTGATIYIPDGAYPLLTGTTSIINTDNVQIVGSSSSGAVLMGDSGVLFQWGDGVLTVVGGGISRVKIRYTSSASTSAICFKLDKASRLAFTDIQLKYAGKLFELGVDATRSASSINCFNIYGTCANIGVPFINLVAGAGFYWTGGTVFVEDVPVPSGTDAHSAASGRAFLTASNYSWDTVVISNVVTNRFWRSLNIIANTGYTISNFFITNFVSDYNGNAGFKVQGLGGNANSYHFSNCWFAATDGEGISVTGASGAISDYQFNSVKVLITGGHGAYFSGGIYGLNLDKCYFLGQGRLTTGDSILMDGNDGWSVTNCTLGIDGAPTTGYSAQARYGIQVAVGCSNYTLSNNNADGSTGGYLIGAHTSGGKNRRIHDNTKVDGTDPEYFSLASLSAPGSGVTVTNYTGVVNTVHIRGGTVTAVAVDGATVQTGSGVSVDVLPGHSWSVTYSSAPTIVVQKQS
jgi:hypothetical protein